MSITWVSFLIVLAFFLVVIESVRRGILETKDSILWIIMSIILSILSLSEGLLEWLADTLGIVYAPSLLFLFGLLYTLVMIFDLTRRISKLNHKVFTLTQEFALMKQQYETEMKELKEQLKEKVEGQ